MLQAVLRVALALGLGAALASPAAAAPVYELAWRSGFENGFPGGEWLDYDDGAFSPGGGMPPGRNAAWSIVSRASGEPVFEGDHAYRGWIAGPGGDVHRAYPGLHVGDSPQVPDPIPAPLVNVFHVWLDADTDALAPNEWIHLATWCNNTDWDVHTMSVREGRLEFAHTDPFSGEYIGPGQQPEFPLRRWVRLTAYIEYDGPEGFVQVWQDGVPMLRARYTRRAGTWLRRAHWGMYADGGVTDAVQYNDAIELWTLSEPLANLVDEPLPAPEPADGGIAALATLAVLGARAGRRARS